MKPIKMVVICKNENWCEQLNKQILNYPTLIVSEIISDYKDLDRAMSQHMPEILISDLDLLISSGYNYEFIADKTMSWEPKLPFVMAIGDDDHRAINNGMRDVFDFWNNKTPEDGSVDDVLRILEGIAPLLSEAKDKLNKK